MSETFTFTDSADPVTSAGGRPSEAIESLYYNSGTKELLVGLVESGRSYLYTGVPVHVYSAFKSAVSKGYFYSKIVKTQYGPGDNFGRTDEVDYVQHGTVHALPLRATAGTPKGLVTSRDTRDTTSASVLAFPLKTEAAPQVPNSLPVPAKQELKFDDAVSSTVTFNMGGDDKAVDFNDKTTVSEAVAEVTRIAEMLGLGEELLIKSVTVHFE